LNRFDLLDIANPFGAPVYRLASCTSTMDEARRLAAEGAPGGTAIAADEQKNGRGRYPERAWLSSAGKNLTFTLILRYPDFSSVPAAVTLRLGLAVARAIADLESALVPAIAVKWPNDVMLGSRKCAGILAESSGSVVLAGIGVNVAERFDSPASAACSIASELAAVNGDRAAFYAAPPHGIPLLLERILLSAHSVLSSGYDCLWRNELEGLLYMKGKNVRFAAGAAAQPADGGGGRIVNGVISGIRADGALLIVPAGETLPEAFTTGELDVYPTAGLKYATR
jgi:BirA family biotin operon repressor/biotin-[acetyl-CoA-carboxylase] ligase